MATAALTLGGTIVGAYFGVRVGAAGKEKVEKARDAEAVMAQEFAARIEPEAGKEALHSARRRLGR